MTDNEEITGFNLDVVAEHSLVLQTRFYEDGRVGVEWVGRCWAWLNGGEAPALMDVVVRNGEVARLLTSGQVRHVRAMVWAVSTPGGRVAGLDVLTDLGWEPRTDPCAAARGLYEGGRYGSPEPPCQVRSGARPARCCGTPRPPSRWNGGDTAWESRASNSSAA